MTTDASKLMSEKLELTREISSIKPELEHLRIQCAQDKGLLSEKLALQRQVSDLEVELGHAKREAQRALAKRRNTMADMAQADEVETLQKTITREKRLREKAEATLEQAQRQVDTNKETVQHDAAVEDAKSQQSASLEIRCEQMSTQLAKAEEEKTKMQKALEKAHSDHAAQKAVTEDKLTQFRNKVRSKNAAITEMQTAYDALQAEVDALKQGKQKTVKAPAKRSAAQMDPDASTLGTPGDKPAKKSRKMAKLGEKSTFSTTPFLNRTMSIVPENDEAQDVASPTAPATTSAAKAPLATVSDSEQNKKMLPKSKTTKVPLKPIEEDDAPAKPPSEFQKKHKARKSIVTFAAFTSEPEPEKKKKRKLGGLSLGKTLFDDDDDMSRGLPGARGAFATTRIGPLKGSLLMGGKRKGLLSTDDGFMFSPLKKDKRNVSVSGS